MAGLPVSPVNAWSYASRPNPHDSGPKRIAIAISYRTFIDYLLPVCPGASQTTVSQLDRQIGGAVAHEWGKERAGARVKYFGLSGGRLRSLSRREPDQALGPLLADSSLSAESQTSDRRVRGPLAAHDP